MLSGFLFVVFFFLFPSLTKLSVSRLTNFAFVLPILCPVLLVVEGLREQLCGYSAADRGQPTTHSMSVRPLHPHRQKIGSSWNLHLWCLFLAVTAK